jgi:hypothetical protein
VTLLFTPPIASVLRRTIGRSQWAWPPVSQSVEIIVIDFTLPTTFKVFCIETNDFALSGVVPMVVHFVLSDRCDFGCCHGRVVVLVPIIAFLRCAVGCVELTKSRVLPIQSLCILTESFAECRGLVLLAR